MSTDTKFHVHHDAPEVVGRRERLGVRLLIVADGSFVFALIFSYFYLRNLDQNGGWIPDGGHTLATSTGWKVVIPLIIAALVHRLAMRDPSHQRSFSAIALLSLAYGAYAQFDQLANLPFIDGESGAFEGAYASCVTLIAGGNLFHYIVAIFLALGLVLRSGRTNVNPVLESWRMRTAGSWFTWIAIAGVAASAITHSFM
jgi:heme/copper-type cytochrome/quinol oxidase subunit 3